MPALPFLRRRFNRYRQSRLTAHRRLWFILSSLGLGAAALLGLLLLGSMYAYAYLSTDLPSLQALPALLHPKTGALLQPTRLYDRSGEHLLAVLAPSNAPRVYTPYDQIPPALIHATVTLQDPLFYRHAGFLLQSPTLAQTLAADLLLWQEEPGLRRALRERILAYQLTQTYGREQILEWYLNTAWYGRNAYGVHAAAQLYFASQPQTLSLAQSALLAALHQTPAINPQDAPQAASQRLQESLAALRSAGFLSAEEETQAQNAPLNLQPALPAFDTSPAFTALALAQLPHRARIERGGMVILTTQDYALQTSAQCLTQTQLARLAEESPPHCQTAALPALPPSFRAQAASASLAVIDPRNGQVLALVGDSTLGQETASVTPQRPGSLLTPYLYLAAFTRGYSPASLVWDLPPADQAPTADWTQYAGPLQLRQALKTANPNLAQQLFRQMGAALVQQTIQPFGFNPPLTDSASLLQTEARYTPLEIARAYGIFAAQGALNGSRQPQTILRIESVEGQPVTDDASPAAGQIVSPQLAYLLTDSLLSDALNRPAAFYVSQNQQEAWAVGYTPYRAVAVWLQSDSALPTLPTEGLGAAILQAASQNQPAEGWIQPPGILRLQVCSPSGMLPTSACPNLATELFLEGYEPLQQDTLYRSYAINRQTGLLATVFTPPEQVENRVFFLPPTEAELWAQWNNLPSPPTAYDPIPPQPAQPFGNISQPALFQGVKGEVTVQGSASGDGFVRYRLLYGEGLNPQAWVLVAESETPVSEGDLAVWDTSPLNGLYTLQLQILRQNSSLQTANLPLLLDNTPPQVGIDSPLPGALLSQSETPQISLRPRIYENLSVARVEFWLDGKLLKTLTAEPYILSWSAVKGEHTLRVLVTDTLGNQAEAQVAFRVR